MQAAGSNAIPIDCRAACPAALDLHLWLLPVDASSRPNAREQARAWLHAWLCEHFDLPPKAWALNNVRGQALAIALDTPLPPAKIAALQGAHFSLAYEGDWALIAFSPRHPIGVDLVRVPRAALGQNAEHWLQLARDYLPPAAAAQLLALPSPHARADYFARAWSQHEAALKALSLPLQEYAPALAHTLGRCSSLTLENLPIPHEADQVWAAALAWQNTLSTALLKNGFFAPE